MLFNAFFFFANLIVAYFGVLLFYRLFGKRGLFGWMSLAVVMSNIEVLVLCPMFGFPEVGGGSILFGTTFFCTDILSECYGKKEANKAVVISMMALVAFTGLIQFDLHYVASNTDFAQPLLKGMFGFMPKICIASILLYFLSSLFDVWLFHKMKCWTNGKHLWLRNNVATMTSLVAQNILFTIIVWWPTKTLSECISMSMAATIIFLIVAACDTPMVYLGRKVYRSKFHEKEN